MRYWFDTEFIEDGKTIGLISIGIVSQDGRELYMVSSEFDASKASAWVKKNVLKQIPEYKIRFSRKHIAEAVKEFVGEMPMFWAYFADYDWVVLCQLYGTMMDLPKGWPMFCYDFKQEMALNGVTLDQLPPQLSGKHNALEDARWLKQAHEYYEKVIAWP